MSCAPRNQGRTTHDFLNDMERETSNGDKEREVPFVLVSRSTVHFLQHPARLLSPPPQDRYAAFVV
jgi:hypothetical protein